MGPRELLATGSLILWGVAALAADVAAQGPEKRARHTHRFVSERRAQLHGILPVQSEERMRAVREALVEDDQGNAFLPVLRAMALAQGGVADDAFLFRGMLCAHTMPEVVDPDGDIVACRNQNLTLYLPYVPPSKPNSIEFHVQVLDAETMDVVWTGRITDRTSVPELQRYQARLTIPGADLPDGDYRIVVRAILDEAEPRSGDPEFGLPFSVLRGFEAGARAMFADLEAMRQSGALEGADLAMAGGMVARVQRVFRGEPPTLGSDPVREFQRAARALANAKAELPLLGGVEGFVAAALPGAEGRDVAVRLTLPAGGGDAAGRPLVILQPGSPILGATGRRSPGVRVMGPGWVSPFLEEWARQGTHHLVVIESPGRSKNPSEDLRLILAQLRELYGVPPERCVLVCEREAAVLLGFQLKQVAKAVAGIVMVAGGSANEGALRALKDTHVLFVADHGTPWARNLDVLRRRLAGEFGQPPSKAPVRFADTLLPAGLGIGSALPDVRRFVDEVVR